MMSLRICSIFYAMSLAATIGCGSGQSSVDLSGRWTTSDDSPQQTLKQWTRKGVIRAPANQSFAELLHAHATLLSPTLRSSRVLAQSETRGLTLGERKSLLADEKTAAAQNYVVILAATTYHRDQNDFSNKRSIWDIDLIVNDGQTLPVKSVVRDRRPLGLLQSEYPWVGDFTEVYTLTFESKTPWIDSNKSIELRLSSSLGHLRLNWQSKE